MISVILNENLCGSAYSLTALVECICDPCSDSPVVVQEPALYQAEEVEHSSCALCIPADVRSGVRIVPAVAQGLVRFVEGRVARQGSVSSVRESSGCADTERVSVARYTENDLVVRDACRVPRLHGRRSRTSLVCGRGASIVERGVRADGI